MKKVLVFIIAAFIMSGCLEMEENDFPGEHKFVGIAEFGLRYHIRGNKYNRPTSHEVYKWIIDTISFWQQKFPELKRETDLDCIHHQTGYMKVYFVDAEFCSSSSISPVAGFYEIYSGNTCVSYSHTHPRKPEAIFKHELSHAIVGGCVRDDHYIFYNAPGFDVLTEY